MFNTPRSTVPQTEYFLDWLDRVVLTQAHRRAAERLVEEAERDAPALALLRRTPQTPPHHAEGSMVSDHVERVLAGILAFQSGASLSTVEECVREKEYLLEFHQLEKIITEHIPFLSAYAVCHDLGKVNTVTLSAPPGSLGSKEAFSPQDRESPPTTREVLERYDKLYRAYGIQQGGKGFFETYQIQAHYPGHARVSASETHAKARLSILSFFRVSASHAKLMTELIRLHMDVISVFEKAPDAEKYRAFGAIAERAGLNRNVFYDLLPACLFLDAVLGSLAYANGEYAVNFVPLFNLFAAEREACPERHAEREEALRRGRKNAVKEVLAEAGLSADEVFHLLQTPYGPVRGKVMEQIYDLIRDPQASATFGEHTEEIRRRADIARTLFTERDIAL